MNELLELTEEFAKRITDIENERKKLGELLRKINSSKKLSIGSEFLEEKIMTPVEKSNFEEMKIAGVDGGLVKRSLHGIDIMLLRAVGVIFQYKNGKLSSLAASTDSEHKLRPIFRLGI